MELENIFKSKSPAEELVCRYLIDTYQSDPEFISDVETHKDRTVAGMMDYIKSKARKNSSCGVAMIEDKTVFNWAFDYWHDPNITTPKKTDAEVKVKPSKAVKTVEADTKPAEKKDYERISLFDL